MELSERYRGVLLGLAAGDALGTTLEFKPPGSFSPITDMLGGGPFGLKPGQWTDDTSMALCLAESLTERQGFDPADQLGCTWERVPSEKVDNAEPAGDDTGAIRTGAGVDASGRVWLAERRGRAMTLSSEEREALKRQVVACLRNEPEIRRVVLFGSFVGSPSPHDLDVAVFQESQEGYLPLALKYRRLLRPVASRIPVDVIPLRAQEVAGAFLREIEQGEVVYVR